MRHKLYILLSVFSLLSVISKAQMFGGTKPSLVDSNRLIRHELGLNVSDFIKTFIVPANNVPLSANATKYLVSYKLLFRKVGGLRLGIGGRFSDKDETDSNFQGTLNVKSNQVNTRIGYEYQCNLSRRWNFYAGADFIYSHGLDRAESFIGFPSQKSITSIELTTLGGGPVAGIQFRLNKRLSLLTEAAVYYQSSKTVTKSMIPDFPENNSSERVTEKSVNFILPTSIFFIVNF